MEFGDQNPILVGHQQNFRTYFSGDMRGLGCSLGVTGILTHGHFVEQEKVMHNLKMKASDSFSCSWAPAYEPLFCTRYLPGFLGDGPFWGKEEPPKGSLFLSGSRHPIQANGIL